MSMTKAEALRQAQIALITGGYTTLEGERGAIEIVPLLDRLPHKLPPSLLEKTFAISPHFSRGRVIGVSMRGVGDR